MKKLGLIGGIGPESTLLYYKKLVYAIHDKADKDFFSASCHRKSRRLSGLGLL